MSTRTRNEFSSKLQQRTVEVLRAIVYGGERLRVSHREEARVVLGIWEICLSKQQPTALLSRRAAARVALANARKAKRGQDYDRIQNGELADLLVDHDVASDVAAAKALLRDIGEAS